MNMRIYSGRGQRPEMVAKGPYGYAAIDGDHCDYPFLCDSYSLIYKSHSKLSTCSLAIDTCGSYLTSC